MADIDLATSYHPRTGNVVNWSKDRPEDFLVRAEITNNQHWELTGCKWILRDIKGPAKLVGKDPLPQILQGENIPAAGGNRVKEFVLEGTGAGGVDVHFEFEWKLDGTDLTYPIKDTVSLTIVGG